MARERRKHGKGTEGAQEGVVPESSAPPVSPDVVATSLPPHPALLALVRLLARQAARDAAKYDDSAS